MTAAWARQRRQYNCAETAAHIYRLLDVVGETAQVASHCNFAVFLLCAARRRPVPARETCVVLCSMAAAHHSAVGAASR